jgi:hypothetical protein
MRLSKSALYTFEKCPYSYYLKYIQRIPTAKSFEMQRGIDFHERADKFFDQISLDDLAQLDTIEKVQEYFESFFPVTEDILYRNFAHMQATHYINLDVKEEFIPVEREFKVEIVDAPDWCLDIGYIDFISQINGETILGEYKTGKFRQGINQEMMFYKDLIEQGTDYKITKLCVIYPMELYGVKLPTGVYYKSPSHEKFARRKVEATKKAIRKGQWFKKKYSLCAWCGVADNCFMEEVSHGLG